MADRVIGTAILDEAKNQLWIVCATDDAKGRCDITVIPVNQTGASPNWKYQIAGTVLNVSPSVRVSIPEHREEEGGPMIPSLELFHNAGAWSVPFLRPNGDGEIYDQCIALNRDLMQDWRAGKRF